MEESLIRIFKLANKLNNIQDKVYAQIIYTADSRQKLQILIISKKDFSYVERCEFQLGNNPILKWNNVAELFEKYVEGTKWYELVKIKLKNNKTGSDINE